MEMRLEKGHGTFSGNSTGHFGKLEGQRMLKKLVSLIPLRGARGPLRLTLLVYCIFFMSICMVQQILMNQKNILINCWHSSPVGFFLAQRNGYYHIIL